MIAFLHQVRLAVRSLVRAPGFVLTATVTLALGIGLSTAVFTVTEALLLRSLPVDDQAHVVALWGETRTGGWTNLPLALDQVREFARGSRALEHVAFFEFRGATPTPVRADDRAYQLRVAMVSGNFFDVLRSRAFLGRALRPEDDVIGAAPVVVLSHRAWQQRFGGDSTMIGRSVSMIQTGRSYTIVGVMPRGLEYPRGTEAWAPIIAYSAAGGFLAAATGELDLLARLRPAASPASARTELTSFFARPEVPAWQRGANGVVHTLPEIVLGDTRPALLVVTLAAALLLIITCVNVANLLLVRALGRGREFAVRSALGSTRGRLVAQQLMESALLSLAGGLLGVGLAVTAVRAFVTFAPGSVPRLEEVGVDGGALTAAVLITAAAMLLSALGPTLFTSRVNAQDALRSGSRHTGGRRVRVAAEALVVIQVALAAMSLSAAGLMTRSLLKLFQADLSFESKDLLVAEFALRGDKFDDPKKALAALGLWKTQLEAVPGVRAVSPVLNVPFVASGGGIDGPLSLPGQSKEETAANPVVNLEVVMPNYFATLRIPVRGRAFSDQDREGAAPVVILSNSAARHFWPREDPIGKQIQVAGGSGATIVGIVSDTRYRELQSARPSVYFPLAQGPFGSILPTTLLIRTTNSPMAVVPILRRIFADANSGLTLTSISPLETLLDAPRAQPRLHAIVLVTFATTAVSLAAIGLFAIIATMVRQRTRELAIRMALGATANNVGRMVMVRGVGLAAVGAVIGVFGALATSRLLSGLLFEIKPTDGITLLAVAGLMLAVAVFASYIPARSGMRIHPATTLGSES